ncbi:hypothetical protein [Streptomyces phaeochromogenes]|uniref:hypothetical protein n=1 Tax=Streptomyces phaeochromogenes TaxID=1923 RepID=UPI002DD963D7|nr:hypothetical protein [Streptomyces phaeochromogenes]WRZ30218.1 hypothetical protein OG931_21935 [Streptomyces phaeochromogenes]
MTDIQCAACHKPIRSNEARARRIGGGCWRKLRPDQRAAIRELTRRGRSLGPREARAALERPAPAGVGQLPIDEPEPTS